MSIEEIDELFYLLENPNIKECRIGTSAKSIGSAKIIVKCALRPLLERGLLWEALSLFFFCETDRHVDSCPCDVIL